MKNYEQMTIDGFYWLCGTIEQIEKSKNDVHWTPADKLDQLVKIVKELQEKINVQRDKDYEEIQRKLQNNEASVEDFWPF